MPMTFADVDAYLTGLPGVAVGSHWGNRTWLVKDHGFAWQRPFSKADLKRFGDETPPAGEILAVRTDGLDAKDALLAMELPGYFTIPHFNGFPAVLIALEQARIKDVKLSMREAFATAAAKPLRKKKPAAKKSRAPKLVHGG